MSYIAAWKENQENYTNYTNDLKYIAMVFRHQTQI